MTIYYHQIEDAQVFIDKMQGDYLRRFNWVHSSNTPGSYWMWRRDFGAEDTDRHARWKAAGPGPMGWPHEPRPYGIITAPTELAVAMTVRFLDEQPELRTSEEE